MNTGEFWASAVAAAVVAVVLGELIDVAAWLAPRIIRHASAHMPTPELQARYCEEWLAELEQLDGLKLIKLGKSISIWVNSLRTRNACDGASSGNRSLMDALPILAWGVQYAVQVVWRGWTLAPTGYQREMVSENPLYDLPLFAYWLITDFSGISFEMTFKMADGSPYKAISLASRDGRTRNARRLLPMACALTVIFYDAYMIRMGIRLRDIRSLHAEARRSLRFRRVSESVGR